MIQELVCPNCHVSLDERHLVTNTWSVESCPHCHALVRKQEGFHWPNHDAIVLEDVAAIGEWLDSVARAQGFRSLRISDEETKGRYVWQVTDLANGGILLRWPCTVEYSSDTPHIFAVRLTSTENGQVFVDFRDRLKAVCAEHGVQPYGEQRSRADWSSHHSEVRWGVQQFLSTCTLSENLFRGVLNRLDKVMSDAAPQLVPPFP